MAFIQKKANQKKEKILKNFLNEFKNPGRKHIQKYQVFSYGKKFFCAK